MTTLLVRRRKGPYAWVIARPAAPRPSIHEAMWKQRGHNTPNEARPGRDLERSPDTTSAAHGNEARA